jgi:ubiquinone/menaquinone biosynthesis C-methylase UbiE
MKNQKKEIVNLYRNEEVANRFDKNRRRYPFQIYKHKVESNFLLKSISKLKKEKIKVLDVACGTGRMFLSLNKSKKNITYFGIDTSDAMMKNIKSLKKKLIKEIYLKKGDATKLPYDSNFFDVVYTFHLLWHLPVNHQEKIIKEMIRVAKPKGIIIFDFLNKDFIYNSFKRKKTKGIYKVSLSKVNKIINSRHFNIQKINDFPVKNEFLYNFLNLINYISFLLPKNLFHMIYIKFRK